MYFSGQLSATGGYQPYSWTADNLPTGVAIDATSGVIYGTPTVVGQFEVAYTVHDDQGQTSRSTFTWIISETETRYFTGTATATKPASALSLATSRAQSAATGAGFGNCVTVDSSTELNEFGTYDAFVTLFCSR